MRTLALLLASSSILIAGCSSDRGTDTTYRTTGQTTTTADSTMGSPRMATGSSTGNVSASGTVPNVGAPGTSGGAVPSGGLASAAVLSSPDDVRTVQNRLRQLNYYGGEMNGMWNADTELALRNFQRSNGLSQGPLDQQTLRAMGLTASGTGGGRLSGITDMREPRMARQAGPSESERMAQMRMMHEQWHRDMDRQGVSNISPSAGASAAAGMTGRSLDPQSIRQVQQKLASEGYYKIPVDGIWGPKSQDGLLQFQESRNLPVTGRLTPETISAMGLDSSMIRPRSGRSL
jgi:peptidoglycan hydrolase-like protein with peptidoglycan-binding domain